MPIVLTQPQLRIAPLLAHLRNAGFETHHWPMSQLLPASDLDVPTMHRQLTACRWALLPSPGAISVVMGALAQQSLAWPAGCGIGLIGPGSRQALQDWLGRVAGLEAAAIVEPDHPPFDAEALLAMPALTDLRGRSIAVLRRADGREAWLQTLRDRGADLHVLNVYRMEPLDVPANARQWVGQQAGANRSIALSIAGADAGLRLAGQIAGWPQAAWLMQQAVLTQHPRIAHALQLGGWARVIEHPPGLEGLRGALESLRTSNP